MWTFGDQNERVKKKWRIYKSQKEYFCLSYFMSLASIIQNKWNLNPLFALTSPKS